MALPSLSALSHAKPAYASPNGCNPKLHLYHQRRSSRQGSFSSSSGTLPDAPRVPCPKDGDAFAYDPKNLRLWYMTSDLWTRLPDRLRASLAATQHAGAAVLTSFERLEVLRCSVDEAELEAIESLGRNSDSNEDSMALPLSGSATPTSSRSSSPSISATMLATPVSSLALPAEPGRAHSSSSTASLSSLAGESPDRSSNRHHKRSFTTPVPPNCAYFLAELSSLRSDALVRLRHSARRVEAEWADWKRECTINHTVAMNRRDSALEPEPESKTGDASMAVFDAEFQSWWAGKRSLIRRLEERGRTVAGTINSPAGWGVA